MNKQVRIILAVSIISALCGLILGFVYDKTRSIIAEAERADFLSGLSEVLPPYDNFPDKDVLEIKGTNVYEAKIGDKSAGYAVIFSSGKGYGGNIYVLVGMDMSGKVSGAVVLKHKETPGLGDKISNKSFLSSFKGLSDPNIIAVKKDGGVIDQFSGATMSPRAVADAVRRALEFMRENFISEEKK